MCLSHVDAALRLANGAAVQHLIDSAETLFTVTLCKSMCMLNTGALLTYSKHIAPQSTAPRVATPLANDAADAHKVLTATVVTSLQQSLSRLL
jgi:hypothetical protein